MRVASSETTIQHYIETYDMARFLNENLLSRLALFHFPAYSNVYIEQDEQHFLYFLVEGQVQCNHYHLDGKLAVFAISNPFGAIGDLEILTDEPLRSNVIATRDTTMLGIARPYVQRYGADDPRFLHFLIDQLRAKLYETNNLQVGQVQPLLNRLAVYILSRAMHNNPAEVVLPEKETLASLLGATSRHLNRVLKQLVESEAISDSYPRVQILNRQTLEDMTI